MLNPPPKRTQFEKLFSIKFFSTNNLFALVILIAAVTPLYQQSRQFAHDREILRDQLVEERRQNDAFEIDLDQAQAQIAQTEKKVQNNAEAIDLVDGAVTELSGDDSAVATQSIAEANAAKKGVLDRAFELKSGMCSRFARQVVEKSHGKKYAKLFGGSAKETANLFLKSAYGYRWPEEKGKLKNVLQSGDLLFKRYGSGGYGHVGVFVGRINGVYMVAENSSTSIGRVQGAKGYRSLSSYGYFDVVGRLPLPVGYKPA